KSGANGVAAPNLHLIPFEEAPLPGQTELQAEALFDTTIVNTVKMFNSGVNPGWAPITHILANGYNPDIASGNRITFYGALNDSNFAPTGSFTVVRPTGPNNDLNVYGPATETINGVPVVVGTAYDGVTGTIIHTGVVVAPATPKVAYNGDAQITGVLAGYAINSLDGDQFSITDTNNKKKVFEFIDQSNAVVTVASPGAQVIAFHSQVWNGNQPADTYNTIQQKMLAAINGVIAGLQMTMEVQMTATGFLFYGPNLAINTGNTPFAAPAVARGFTIDVDANFTTAQQVANAMAAAYALDPLKFPFRAKKDTTFETTNDLSGFVNQTNLVPNTFTLANGFVGVPSFYLNPQVDTVTPSQTGVVTGDVPVPITAGDLAHQIATEIAGEINALPQQNPTTFGQVKAVVYGGQVEVTGVSIPPGQVPPATSAVFVGGGSTLTAAGTGPGGDVSGMTWLGNNLYAVSTAGGLYQVNQPPGANNASTILSTQNYAFRGYPEVATHPTDDPTAYPSIVPTGGGPSATWIATATQLATIGSTEIFTGLSAGPPDVDGGFYANFLFACTQDGKLYCINPTTGALQPVFQDGQYWIQMTGPGGAPLTNVTGLAFSTLDYNLWHPTNARAGNAGHGIDVTYDQTRNAINDYGQAGNTSYYFGLEDPRIPPTAGTLVAQPHSADYEFTNPQIYSTYNLPGGAQGSLIAQTPFSLVGYSAGDQPTLYFNYYLDTENSGNFDGAKVYISADGGANWHFLVSNTENVNNTNVANRPQLTWPSTTGGVWLQEVVNLSGYVGDSNLLLRFDFSTAADLEVENPTIGGSYLEGLPGNQLDDGQTFTVDNQIFEFDMGQSLVVPNAAGTVIPNTATFNLYDTKGNTVTFEFTTTGANGAALADGNTGIAIATAMDAQDVAANMMAAINAAATLVGVRATVSTTQIDAGGNVSVMISGAAAPPAGSTILPAGSMLTLGATSNGAGTVGAGNVPVAINPNMTAVQVTAKIAAAIDQRFSGNRTLFAPSGSALTTWFDNANFTGLPGNMISSSSGSQLVAVVGSSVTHLAKFTVNYNGGQQVFQFVKSTDPTPVLPVLPIVYDPTAGTGDTAASLATKIATAIQNAAAQAASPINGLSVLTFGATVAIYKPAQFTLNDGANTVTFSYVPNVGQAAVPGTILVAPGDSDQAVATATAAAINAENATGNLAIQATVAPNTNLITLTGTTVVFTAGSSQISLPSASRQPLVAPPGSQIKEGDSFQLSDGNTTVTFTFSNTIQPGAANIIRWNAMDTAATTATDIQTAITLAGALPFQLNITATTSGALIYLAGPVADFTNVNSAVTAVPQLTAVSTNLANNYDSSVKVDGTLIHVYTHTLTIANGTDGELPASNMLPGDRRTVPPTPRLNDYGTGQKNAQEGFYIDDIIVGFAGRGQMYTNAPADLHETGVRPDQEDPGRILPDGGPPGQPVRHLPRADDTDAPRPHGAVCVGRRRGPHERLDHVDRSGGQRHPHGRHVLDQRRHYAAHLPVRSPVPQPGRTGLRRHDRQHTHPFQRHGDRGPGRGLDGGRHQQGVASLRPVQRDGLVQQQR
ncbi:MAG: hypothetical protein ABSG68_21450, partial [Thermoguttaceae bacterium]